MAYTGANVGDVMMTSAGRVEDLLISHRFRKSGPNGMAKRCSTNNGEWRS
jgi:hypothetical protein